MHKTFHNRNKNNPEAALVDAMEWWSNLKEPPSEEDRTIYDWAPFLNEKLEKDNIKQLSLDDFIEVCSRIHAFGDHSTRVKHTILGYPERLPHMKKKERIKLLAEWLYKQRSKGGRHVMDTIYYVLYGGPVKDVPNRIFDAKEQEEWKIRELGIGTIGEMIGWAMPNQFPPRNGRTSKALSALGYEVTIHTEKY